MTRDPGRTPKDDPAALAELLDPGLLDGRTPDGELMRAMVRQRLFGDHEPAFRFDRFIVLSRIGHGGMGVVYEAYDPELERKVALKVVRPASGEQAARERMLREARALARLSHPNVVPVFEVGEQGDDVFIAMELVRGETLRAYASAAGRTSREIVDAYVQAGRGLAAAHEVGLVHRDFKPSNAIVGEDGRVRVLDFGLARDAGSTTPMGLRGTPDPLPPTTAETLTPAGAIVGTPAYMAPEQRLGEAVTPASDQYSLCASLHEALAGRLPKLDLVGEEIQLGSLPRHARRLRPILARGLSLRADDRWPSMDALCTALERVSHPRRRLVQGALALGLAGVLIAAVMVPRESPCEADAAALAGVWDESRRATVEAALLGTGASFAAPLAEDATAALDRYADGFAELRTEACVAHHVDRATSAALFDRAMACLERRRERLSVLVERLEQIDAGSVPRVMDALRALPPLEPCRDREALLAALPPPEDPAVAAQVGEVRQRLDASTITGRLGNLDEALALALEGGTLAQASGWRPIQAEAAFELGTVHLTRRELDDAVAKLDEAVWLGEAGHHDELVAGASSRLVSTLAMHGKLEEARAQARRTRAAIERLGRRTRADAELEDGLGNVARLEGKLEEARDHYARAVEHAEHVGLDPANVGELLDNLATMYASLGEYEHGFELWQRAHELKRSGYGELHPSVLRTRMHIGTAQLQSGRIDEALATLQGVLEDAERSTVGTSELVAAIHNNLATVHTAAGRHAEALVHAEHGVAAYRKALGSDHPQLFTILMTLGAIYGYNDRRADARAALEEAVALGRATGVEGASLASVLLNLAMVERGEGDLTASLRHSEEAVRLLETSVGPRHAELSRAHLVTGTTRQALGDHAGAIEAARRAIETTPASGPGSDRALATASMQLAQRLADQGTLAEAREHARTALAARERLGDEPGATKVRAWLEEHGGG